MRNNSTQHSLAQGVQDASPSGQSYSNGRRQLQIRKNSQPVEPNTYNTSLNYIRNKQQQQSITLYPTPLSRPGAAVGQDSGSGPGMDNHESNQIHHGNPQFIQATGSNQNNLQIINNQTQSGTEKSVMNTHHPIDLRLGLGQSRPVATQPGQPPMQLVSYGNGPSQNTQNMTQLIVPSSQVQLMHNSGNGLNMIPHQPAMLQSAPTAQQQTGSSSNYYTSASLQSQFEHNHGGKTTQKRQHNSQQPRGRVKRVRKESVGAASKQFEQMAAENSQQTAMARNPHGPPTYIRQASQPQAGDPNNVVQNLQDVQIKLISSAQSPPMQSQQQTQQQPFQAINNNITVNVNLNGGSDSNQLELAKQIVEVASQQVMTQAASRQSDFSNFMSQKQASLPDGHQQQRLMMAGQPLYSDGHTVAQVNQSLGNIKSQTLQQGRSKRPASAKRATRLAPASGTHQSGIGGAIQQHQPYPSSQPYNQGFSGTPLSGLVVEGKTKRPSYVQKGGGGTYTGLASGGTKAVRSKSSMSNDQTPPTNVSARGQTASTLSKANQSSIGHSRHFKNIRTLSGSQGNPSNFVRAESSAGAGQPSSMQSTQNRARDSAAAVSSDRQDLSRKTTELTQDRHADSMIDQVDLASKSMTPQRPTDRQKADLLSFSQQTLHQPAQNPSFYGGPSPVQTTSKVSFKQPAATANQAIQQTVYNFGGPPVGLLVPVPVNQNSSDFKGFSQAGQPVQARHHAPHDGVDSNPAAVSNTPHEPHSKPQSDPKSPLSQQLGVHSYTIRHETSSQPFPSAGSSQGRVAVRQDVTEQDAYPGIPQQMTKISPGQPSITHWISTIGQKHQNPHPPPARKKASRPPSAKLRNGSTKNHRQAGPPQGGTFKQRVIKSTTQKQDSQRGHPNTGGGHFNNNSKLPHQPRRQYHQAYSLPAENLASAPSAAQHSMTYQEYQKLNQGLYQQPPQLMHTFSTGPIPSVLESSQRAMSGVDQTVSPQLNSAGPAGVAKIPAFISQTAQRQPLVVLGGQAPQGYIQPKPTQAQTIQQRQVQNARNSTNQQRFGVADQVSYTQRRGQESWQSDYLVKQQTGSLQMEERGNQEDMYHDSIAQTPEPSNPGGLRGSISVKNMRPMANLTQPLFSQKRRGSNNNPPNPNNTRVAQPGNADQTSREVTKNRSSSNGGDTALGVIVSQTEPGLTEGQMTHHSSVNSYGRASKRKSARPRSGIPMNRAPFRPAGVAKMSDLNSPSKRNVQGRISATGAAMPRGVMDNKRGSKLNTVTTSHKASNDGDDESDESEYEDYGSEASAEESDDADEVEANEQLQFDDENEYSPAKLNNASKEDQEGSSLAGSPMPKRAQGLGRVNLVGRSNISHQQSEPTPDKVNDKSPGPGKGLEASKGQLPQASRTSTLAQNNAARKTTLVGGARQRQVQQKAADEDSYESGDEEDEELSDGYLDGEEGGEEESPARKALNSLAVKEAGSVNSASNRGTLPLVKEGRTSLQQQSQSQSKDVLMRSIETKKGAPLAASTSMKVIDNKNTLESNPAKSVSKRSLELSDTCPKEDLVRRLYQRPGLSLDNLNSKLRSISIKQKEPGSPGAHRHASYQMGSGQFQNQSYGAPNHQDVLISEEMRRQAAIDELAHLANLPDAFAPKNSFERCMPVFLSRSPFTGRPPTVFFNYPPHINEQPRKPHKSMVFKMRDNKFKLKFKISESVHTYNCVVNTLCFSGFTQTEGANWNVMWSAPLKPETLRHYDMYKHCNHFAGTWQLGRKDLMYRNISAQIREFGEEYNIVPRTWILPYDLRPFQKERDDAEGKRKLWILKPAASSCGRGIKILSKHSSLPKRGPYVVNEYIMKPHLFNGFKYDLRLYVLVTSFEPLTIYLHQDGLARFATQPYTTKNRKSRFAHLTNFSVNKKATNYKKAGTGGEGEEENFSKWSLKTLQAAFANEGLNYEEVLARIKDLVIKAVISVEPLLANNLNRASRNRHLCFEVFGFDVILDQNMKPWLLEVNVLPSLSSSSLLDKKVKTSLMCDVFSTIGITPYSKKRLEKMQETTKWKRFSGLNKQAGSTKNREDEDSGIHDDDHQRQGSSSNQSKGLNAKKYVSTWQNNGNAMYERDEYCSEDDDGNNAWSKTYQNMAQSQSNYMPGKIRSVKEIQGTADFNVEEQLVIVELVEEYSRRGQFDLIFPRRATVDKYKKYFKVPRACNTLVWKWLKLSNSAATVRQQTAAGATVEGTGAGTTSVEASPTKEKKAHPNRFSVLKDFKIRKNCPEQMVQDLRQL